MSLPLTLEDSPAVEIQYQEALMPEWFWDVFGIALFLAFAFGGLVVVLRGG